MRTSAPVRFSGLSHRMKQLGATILSPPPTGVDARGPGAQHAAEALARALVLVRHRPGQRVIVAVISTTSTMIEAA